MQAAPAAGRPYLIHANIDADQNPQGAGVWELRSRPLAPRHRRPLRAPGH
jgi:hypothetical protein